MVSFKLILNIMKKRVINIKRLQRLFSMEYKVSLKLVILRGIKNAFAGKINY